MESRRDSGDAGRGNGRGERPVGGGATASMGETLGLVADPVRRRALAVLQTRGGPTTLGALARAVARRETDEEPAALSADRLERYRIALHHTHLPKLADAGLVTYDYSTDEVALAVEPTVLSSLLADLGID